jgi:hypothetical protein
MVLCHTPEADIFRLCRLLKAESRSSAHTSSHSLRIDSLFIKAEGVPSNTIGRGPSHRRVAISAWRSIASVRPIGSRRRGAQLRRSDRQPATEELAIAAMLAFGSKCRRGGEIRTHYANAVEIAALRFARGSVSKFRSRCRIRRLVLPARRKRRLSARHCAAEKQTAFPAKPTSQELPHLE